MTVVRAVDDPDEARRLDAQLPEIDWGVLPAGVTARRVAVPSGELAVIEAGDPAHPRVLLAPGVTGSKEDFLLVMPPLADAGFFVQAVDLAGQYESGQAGPPPGRRYDYELFVADMIALLESGPTPVHLLGYSFAGTVAAIVAVRRPELVRSLTLMAMPPDSGNGFRHMKRIGPVISRIATGRMGASLMIWGVTSNLNKVTPERLAFVRSRFALTSRASVDDIIGIMKHAPDVDARLRELPIPKLVAIGVHDLWPASRSEALAERIGARYAAYDTGHAPSETAPHQLVRDLLALYAMA